MPDVTLGSDSVQDITWSKNALFWTFVTHVNDAVESKYSLHKFSVIILH